MKNEYCWLFLKEKQLSLITFNSLYTNSSVHYNAIGKTGTYLSGKTSVFSSYINSYFNQLGEGIGAYTPPQVQSLSRKPLTVAFEEIASGKVCHVSRVSTFGWDLRHDTLKIYNQR